MQTKRLYTRVVSNIVAAAVDFANGACDAISVNAAGILTIKDIYDQAVALVMPVSSIREVRAKQITNIVTSTNVTLYYSELVSCNFTEVYLAEVNGEIYFDDSKPFYYDYVDTNYRTFKFDKL